MSDDIRNTEALPLADLLSGGLDVLEAVGENKPGTRIPTGHHDLDAVLGGGLWPSTLTVVASRPSVGTTTLLLDFCRYPAIRRGIPTLLVSYRVRPTRLTW